MLGRCREFVKEQKADRVLFRNTFGTQPLGGAATNAFNLRLKNPANTNVVEWGNRLLALWEVQLCINNRKCCPSTCRYATLIQGGPLLFKRLVPLLVACEVFERSFFHRHAAYLYRETWVP